MVTPISDFSIDEIRNVITVFLDSRLQPKLDKLKDDDLERDRLIAAHEPETWLADAARRVMQIQQVTHAIKYTHPDARGSSLYSQGNAAAGELLAGTHSLGEQLMPDVVGNAAALDVYKFLRLSIDGTSVLGLAISGDERLRQAFSSDADKAEQWMQAFAALVESKGKPASHKLAKQLYWSLGGGKYHLLAPLFPSSLVSHTSGVMREHRFSDEAKAARAARKNKVTWQHGFHEYPNVVVQKFGGTKPQNISQLNSERYGENHLLPSLPPNWRSEAARPPLRVDSVFQSVFGKRPLVQELLHELHSYLIRVASVNNLAVRDGRASRVQALVDELFQFAAEQHEMEPGWSADPACQLNSDERCWLDPKRAERDEHFASLYLRGSWQQAVSQRFGNWLNARLRERYRGLPVGEDEAHEWSRIVEQELNMLRRELSRHD
ncbi:MAG TPA: type I-F CRISPR-associated protein Csy1 [Pseudomonas xinjiangensis]|uniref:Type I-F CRISPR-associated protein Csy1 n=2 Tax=root TaxID=1 RepID=A0A7V1FR23_9GAMM|nr:type I-F CRISPR-associated protein Csy1 [Halopseudomonas xinjiangensis]HEC47058.1 type I-F CRISPR-associated protein Csy1 [Halopseudomonas xinjiangensis]